MASATSRSAARLENRALHKRDPLLAYVKRGSSTAASDLAFGL